ncbi:MAG: anaerobic magnesium-protoporphyrin IX monomethyl ester cyclase [Chlamydiales bacterium]|jgi:anaerobic magnesium-protoporphyrin IX monomethyl ester cyclase
MKTLLLFPPQGHFTQPYLSLPSLTAWLKQNGYEDVTQMDLSMQAFDTFLSRERLQRSLDRVRERESFATLNGRERLNFSEMERYQALSEIELTAESVIENIDQAKYVMRNEDEFYDHERYLWAGRTIEQALRLFSAEYAPTKLSSHGFVMRYPVESTSSILEAIHDEKENPFIDFYRECVIPRIRELDPDLIGISLTFGSQAIPSFTLARLIKEWKPECHITMGGGLLAYVGKKLAGRDEIWDVIDSFAMLEGEGPLLGVVRAVDEGLTDLTHIPNLIWRAEGGEVQFNPHAEPLNIHDLPTPDFEGFPLDKYFSPELMLPLAATRGCYWGKCVFCTLYTVIGPGYRGRSLDDTVDDMAKLQAKHGARHFYLAIEDLPPNMARALPKKILERGLDVRWWCDARLEHEVFTEEVCRDLYESGCRRIAFGYESASERVLEAMCKGIDPKQSMDIIQRVHEAGISVTLYAMVGFPTETREEARQTLQTILDNRQWIQEVSVRVFYLDESSEIYRRREEFAITEVYPDPEADLQVYYDFKADRGMSRREARDMYFEFTQALRTDFPVFQNTNMLYHELKGHYFLYLTKFGGWDNLKEQVLDRTTRAPVTNLPDSKRLQLREDLRVLPLAFDRNDLDDRLREVDNRTLRPRFQSDLISDEDRQRFDRELKPLEICDAVLVYDPRSADIRCLSPEAWTLLERCDGSRTMEGVVEIFPQPNHKEARACLSEMAGAGLFGPIGSQSPEEVTA